MNAPQQSPSSNGPQAGAASLEQTSPVLFFDGVCGLCNHAVNFVFRHDRRGLLRVSPLQGELAAKTLPAEDIASLKSVVLLENGRLRRRSAAAVRVLILLGGPWGLAGCLLWLIPFPLRDLGYALVAKTRYRLFGRKETCRLPTPEERARFIN